MRLLDRFKPFFGSVPDVELPERKQLFRDKAVYTFSALIVYLVMSNLPVFGVKPYSAPADAMAHMRLLMGASRGSLLELGVAPLLTANLVTQMLVSARVISVNYSVRDDRGAAQTMTKLFAIVLAAVMATLYVFSGCYGDASPSSPLLKALVAAQLTIASVVVILLDEALQKGYGMGSGASLFPAVITASDIVWKLVGFSRPIAGSDYPGIVLAVPQILVQRENKFYALYDVLFRTNDGLFGIAATVTTAAAAILLMHLLLWRVEVTVAYQKYRGAQGAYPIKLLYVSSIPVLLMGTITANICFFSQVLHSAFPASKLIAYIFGKWVVENGNSYPVSGIAYYVSAPRGGLLAVLLDPLHALLYVCLAVAVAITTAKAWVELSGSNARGVSKELQENNMAIKGHRGASISHEVGRYIEPATALGALAVAALASVVDLTGIYGAGGAVVVAVTVVFQYYEIISRESGGNINALLAEN